MSTSNASKKESKWQKYTKVEWCIYVNNVNAFVFVEIL